MIDLIGPLGQRRGDGDVAAAAGLAAPFFSAACISVDAAANFGLASFSETRSCGRRGPARHGSMAPRSTSMTLA